MAINIKNQIFTLHTKNSTYQMKVDEQNMLIHTYYGNRTDDTDCSYLIRMADRGFSGNIPGTDSKQYVEGGLQLRVISEIQPELECMSIPATLEDAYIYVTNQYE